MTPTLAFDPFADVFVAQERRPDGVEPVNLRALSPFHRALLAIDGTVTTFLEAYTMEPIVVDLLAQQPRSLEAEHAWLDLSAGSRVLVRQVDLRGAETGVVYAHARSVLALDRLPAPVVRAIDVDPRGLGGAMLACRMETRREVLWYGRERSGDVGAPSGYLDLLSRAYRVMFRDHPVMLINERFPLDDDLVPTHH